MLEIKTIKLKNEEIKNITLISEGVIIIDGEFVGTDNLIVGGKFAATSNLIMKDRQNNIYEWPEILAKGIFKFRGSEYKIKERHDPQLVKAIKTMLSIYKQIPIEEKD